MLEGSKGEGDMRVQQEVPIPEATRTTLGRRRLLCMHALHGMFSQSILVDFPPHFSESIITTNAIASNAVARYMQSDIGTGYRR